MSETISLPLEKESFSKKRALLTERYAALVAGSLPVAWQILFFYLPLTLLLLSSFVHKDPQTGSLSFGFVHYGQIATATYVGIVLQSILLAFLTALFCLLISLPLSYLMSFKFRSHGNLLLFLLMIPFWTNFLLHVCAWNFVLEQDGFLNEVLLRLGCIQQPISFLHSYFSTMVMMVYYYLPFMVLPIYSAFERFDTRLLEASMNLGANWPRTLLHVLFPLSLSSIRSGIFLVFIPSFGEFVIPELMGGDRTLFVGSTITHLISETQTTNMATAFTVLSVVLLMIAGGAIYLALSLINKRLCSTGGT